MNAPGSAAPDRPRAASMRIRFITATPLNLRQGSGTFAGIRTLANSLEGLGAEIEFAVPSMRLPVFTAERLWFNAALRPAPGCDLEIGFDMDGYRLAGRGSVPHVAALKGVIADELRFQKGLTRETMRAQARCEGLHARRADLVVATSRYSAKRIRSYYGVEAVVVPEGIELGAWRAALAANPGAPDPARFRVLCVCRLYRRKRVDILLRAAALLRERIPELEIRIAGDGPERAEFYEVYRRLGLGDAVRWLGQVEPGALAAEYNGCQAFCLPSVQEGFGIVFLEAMAAGKPVVAARAAAAPEVLPQGLLAEPDDPESLARELECLYRSERLRGELAEAGLRRVREFDAARVGRLFLDTVISRVCKQRASANHA